MCELRRILFLSCLIAASVVGGVQTAKAQGNIVSAAEIARTFTGRTAIIGTVEATWGKDGSYRVLASGQQSTGRYTITDEQICVIFDPRPGASSRTRCDKITRQGGGYTLTNSVGQTYSVIFK